MARPMQTASRRSSTPTDVSSATARKRPREDEDEEGSASQEAEDRWVGGWLASNVTCLDHLLWVGADANPGGRDRIVMDTVALPLIKRTHTHAKQHQ